MILRANSNVLIAIRRTYIELSDLVVIANVENEKTIRNRSRIPSVFIKDIEILEF